MLYDMFISHASEDKDTFVRPLAERLKSARVEVWYDEFSLKPGDSLRQSIDRGLAKSRYGLIVLSPHFFRKPWSEWELNGLLQRQLSSPIPVIIPIWHEVDRADVNDYSPPLADILAIKSSEGLDKIVKRILAVLHPEGSTLLIARDQLVSRGIEPPVVTDDWWLDVLENTSNQDGRRWCFPIWFMPEKSAPRGEFLAWAAMQNLWQEEVESRPITQLTRPETVLAFVDSQPGLAEICGSFPGRFVEYAPQLTIPGFGGRWEPFFDQLLADSIAEYGKLRRKNSKCGTALTTDGHSPLCDEIYALRHPAFGNYDPEHVACGFVQGNGAGFGPSVRAYNHFDYAVWFLSEQSSWLPSKHREFLIRGMKRWATWWDYRDSENPAFKRIAETGKLSEAMFAARSASSFRLTAAARRDLLNRTKAACALLRLPEKAKELVDAFIDAGFIQAWFEANDRRKKRMRKSSRPKTRGR